MILARSHSAGFPWPTRDWQIGELGAADVDTFADLVAEAFAAKETPTLGETHALLIVQGGRITFERYGEGFDATSTHRSHSVAKSITHALVGLLVADGKLDIARAADVAEWADDERARITLDQLLRMSSGLKFTENYVASSGPSDVISMLFYEGKGDVGAYAAAQPLEHEPGTHWAYSSGTTNIVCRIAARALSAYGRDFKRFMWTRLFQPLGILSAQPGFDVSGVFIGSTYCDMNARDFARFGLLYLCNGIWEGRQILPEGWVSHARAPTFQQEGVTDGRYGAHWWLDVAGQGSFSANGYDGQFVVVAPDRDLVIVRHGVTPPQLMDNLKAWIGRVSKCLVQSPSDVK